MELRNIEFNTIPGPDGNVEVRMKDKPTFLLLPVEREFVVAYIILIQTKRPLAYARLHDRFIASKPNRIFHEFLIVRRHIRCNFGIFDNKPDIDEHGNFNTEYIPCPHCSECEDYGFVCNSSETVLLSSEMNVLRLLADEHTTKEISELLYLSEHTVHNHRNNMLKRIGAKNTVGLIKYYYENNLNNQPCPQKNHKH